MIIKQQDFINSIANALQFISYYLPRDFIKAMDKAYQHEKNPAAKDAIAQILINARMSAEGRRPVCQDTGIVTVFLKIGMDVQFETEMTIQELVDQGVRQAYTNSDNPLRASIVADPAGARINTKDNTPSVVHVEMVRGTKVEILLAAKGGGSENKSKMAMLNPSDSIADWVEKMLPTMGAGWCPPGMLGIGVGGTVEKAAVMAKESLMESIDIGDLITRKEQGEHLTADQQLRLEIMSRVNALGIGAQGLGGLTTVLDVKIKSCPTHAASKPVVMIPNCAATRHIHITLDGQGEAVIPDAKLSDFPKVAQQTGERVHRINVNDLTKADVSSWKSGDTLLLSGKILTGRDAAHKRIAELINAGKPLPNGVDFNGKFIYYVGPVDAVRNEVVGPAGPTTSTRMDKFTDLMLAKAGLLGMIGKSERGQDTINSIAKHKSVYLMAVGGAAYLVAKAIKKSRVVAFADLGMEAIYEFEIEDMPVTVAVDSLGNNIHAQGPAIWKSKIAELDEKLTR